MTLTLAKKREKENEKEERERKSMERVGLEEKNQLRNMVEGQNVLETNNIFIHHYPLVNPFPNMAPERCFTLY